MDEVTTEPEQDGPIGAGAPVEAHAVSDDTVISDESVRIDDTPTVGMAAYLGSSAEPPPPVDFVLPTSAEPVATPAAAAAAAAVDGPHWIVVALLAAFIGGLFGAGLVAVLDKDDGRSGNNASFGNNTSVLAQPQDIQGVLARVEPGVVSVKTQAFQRGPFGDAMPAAGAGTGMIITENGEVLTNAHVVRGATSIQVTLFGEKEPRFADLVGTDPTADVAIIKIRDANNLPTVKLGNSGELRVGDSVLAIGNALALPGGPSVTSGIVSGLDRAIGADDEELQGLIQTDAAINRGNSGGPLVNAAGEVVGMNTAVIQSTGEALVQNVGFAIAIDTIKPMLDRLRSGGGNPVGSTAFIGVISQTLTSTLRQELNIEAEKGALIGEVTPGSPAENAGILPGDVVTKVGDTDIESSSELQGAVRARKPGEKVEVTVRRGRETKKFTVTLGARPGGRN